MTGQESIARLVPRLQQSAPAAAEPLLPKTPVLGWSSLRPGAPSPLPSVGDLPHRAYTTSGRAALMAALGQLELPADAVVLVPTYHCPTMVAPVLRCGLTPAFFPIGGDGLPLLGAIPERTARAARVMFVAHYFGLGQSLQAVQQWCRERGIVMVEDCAHGYFGQAGDRPIGRWGDYATASLSKFFPVGEAGLLASASRELQPLGLGAPGWRAQVKGVVDIVEIAHRHGRLGGLRHLLAPFLWLKNRRQADTPAESAESEAPSADAEGMMAGADMGRTRQQACAAAIALHRMLPQGRIVARRRANYAALATGLARAPGAKPLRALPDDAAPYVCPVWVDGAERADAVYARLRSARLPVFRWDYLWPGTPDDPQETGRRWSRQMLQLLCHQDLSESDIARVCESTLQLLNNH